MSEFGIAHEAIKKGDEWHIVGRCVTDIHVGDQFTKFVPIHLVGEPGPENMNFVRDEPVPIDLTIVQITAYRNTFDVLSAGMTAALVLRGDGDNLTTSGSLCGS